MIQRAPRPGHAPWVMPSSPLPTSKGPWFCHLSPWLGSMPDVSPVLSLPYRSSGITLLLQSLVCGLGLCCHQVILLFRISPPHRCFSTRAGWEPLGPRPRRPVPLRCPTIPLLLYRHRSWLPVACRVKLKPDLPIARLSRRTCCSLREPSTVFRRPLLPHVPFR